VTTAPDGYQVSVVDGRVTVIGDVDALTAPRVEECLNECDSSSEIHLDASEVTFLDSGGLRLLISQHNRFEASGGRLIIVAPSRPVARLLEITALIDLLHIVSD
jgi:anti-sigma B factor antagonist